MWISSLNIKYIAIKCLVDNREENLQDLRLVRVLSVLPKAQFIKIKNREIRLHKKDFPVKDSLERIKRQAADWKKIFIKHIW